jgi:D-threo-aldose 1-dehydrogenase
MTVPRLSRLALGTAGLGGLYAPVSDAQAEQTVRRALDLGINYLDTAPHYGAGVSEQRVGRALAGVPRHQYVLSTKVGRLLRPLAPGEPADDQGFPQEPPAKRVWDFSADGVRRSLMESLGRLGVDRVDIVYLHDPDDFEDAVYESAYAALADLREAGVVRAIGAGMNQAEMLTRFVRRLDLDVVLMAGRYTLLDQRAGDELLPACAERGVSVVIGGPFNSGLLADPRPGAPYDYRSAPPEMVRRATRLRDVCARHGVPLTAAALQFPLGHPAVISVLNGARSAAELEQNASSFAAPVPAELWDDLRESGLISPDLPTPVASR